MVIQFPPDLQMKRQMERIRSSVDQYRNAPYRSADWLAGELMTIFDTEPANDVIAALDSRAGDAGEGKAIADVAAERARQMSVEGWSPEHDDQHTDRSLATAAACYTLFAAATNEARAETDLSGSLSTLGKPLKGWAAFLQIWPWERRWWKPKSRRSDLVRAGALIIAEIERLDRREAARG